MTRIVSVWLPHWPVECLARRSPGLEVWRGPLALVETGAQGVRIAAVNALARQEGIAQGSSLADARAVLPSLATLPCEAGRNRAALAGLVRWLGRYVPMRNRDGSEGAWIDVTGVPHLFGGEAALLDDLVRRLGRQGVSAQAGLADTLGAAWALARYGASPGRPVALAPPGGARTAVGRLPVEALRLAVATTTLLRRLGLKRISDLYGVPRVALERRFQEQGVRRREAGEGSASVLLRLDQVLGLVREPRAPMGEPPESHVRLPFAEPLLSGEAINAAIDLLARDLLARLEAQGLGGRRFFLRLYRADGTVAEVAAGTSLACREAAHLCRLLGERTDGIDAGFGIDLVELAASRLERLEARQSSIGGSRREALHTQAGALVDRLAGRLGAAAVARIEGRQSHIPERAQRFVQADGAFAEADQKRGSVHAAGRPELLVVPPEPVEVMAELPEGAPARLLWRRGMRRIVRAEGPERIAPEWWRAIGCGGGQGQGKRTRDYYRLEDEAGCGYWVYREGLYGGREGCGGGEDEAGDGESLPRWFLQGVRA